MNPTVALALIALLQREVNLLELQLAQLQASSAPIVATATPLNVVTLQSVHKTPIDTTFQYEGKTYLDTPSNMNVMNEINSENSSCATQEDYLKGQESNGFPGQAHWPAGQLSPGQAVQQLQQEEVMCANQIKQYISQLQ